MRYKILKGTKLYDQLSEVQNKLIECHDATAAFVNKLGFREWREKVFVVAGGISSIDTKGVKPEGWKNSGVEGEYIPAKKNKELTAEMEALPVVEYEDINSILGYSMRRRTGNRIAYIPEITFGKECHLVAVKDYMLYTPLSDMIEILHSEYESIKSELSNS